MKLTRNLCFDFTVDGEKIAVTMRQPTSSELSAHLKARFPRTGGKIHDRQHEARVSFGRSLLVDLSGMTCQSDSGDEIALCRDSVLSDGDKAFWAQTYGRPVAGWKDIVPDAWLAAWAARFEGEQPQGIEFGDESVPLA